MKYLSKFENFDTDETRYMDGNVPNHNPVISLKAKNFVEKVFNQGAGSDVNNICKEIGAEIPRTDEDLDTIKDLAIKYYTENPERIGETGETPVKRYNFGGGDRVVRTNNVGGSLRESRKPSPDDDECVKIDLSSDDMRLFQSEAMLMRLIRSNKISLYKQAVWYRSDDEKTKKTLDIFFDVEGEDPKSVSEIKEGLLGFKKALNFDKTYTSSQDAWNQINDEVHKRWKHLKNTDNGTGFTNGVREVKIKLTEFDGTSKNKTLKLNGETVNFDDLKSKVFQLVRTIA